MAADSPRPRPDRLRALPSRLLGLASMRADRLIGDGLAAVGARKWHYAVLATLQEYGPASQSELSRRSGIYRSDMVAVLNLLAGEGHVERTPDPADRRRNVITITESGRRRLAHLDALLADLQKQLLAPLDEHERGELVRLLRKLTGREDEEM